MTKIICFEDKPDVLKLIYEKALGNIFYIYKPTGRICCGSNLDDRMGGYDRINRFFLSTDKNRYELIMEVLNPPTQTLTYFGLGMVTDKPQAEIWINKANTILSNF